MDWPTAWRALAKHYRAEYLESERHSLNLETTIAYLRAERRMMEAKVKRLQEIIGACSEADRG